MDPLADPSVGVLQAVDEVARELHAHAAGSPSSLDSRLERDLGLDSLAMAEVLARLEEVFAVRLPSGVLATAETPRDLLRAVGEAGRREADLRPAGSERPAAPTDQVPSSAATLLEVLDWHCGTHPGQTHLTLLDEGGPGQALTYEDLRAAGLALASGLVSTELLPGETVALMLPTGREYFESFIGVLAAGGVPVPIYPPARPSQIEDHLRRQALLLANARAALMITTTEAHSVARLLSGSVETMRSVVTPSQLFSRRAEVSLPRPTADDTALIQYTSGSTGAPKGVVLSHANLLANIHAMGQAAKVTPADSFVSWLPLYHDMGLIGAWLGSLCLGMPTTIMSPLAFLARPAFWLSAIDGFRASMTAAPNFAYELCLRKVTDRELASLDLSSLRMVFNGAEPVSAETMERFAQRFAPCGLDPTALAPVYGLAESAVGLAFPPPGRGLLVDTVARGPLHRDGLAVRVEQGRADSVRVVACGQPLPGHEIRVVDDSRRELPERVEGRIEFRGPSATVGYYRNPEATRQLIREGWLDSGDLGYMAGGDVYVTGRSKDLIIRAGRNLHPEDLETAVGELYGVRKGCVAVFATPDAVAGTDRLVIVAETREEEEGSRQEIHSAITAATVDMLGTPPDDVVLAPPGTVLKTSSGKIRRAATRSLYEAGTIGARARRPWWQLVRFGWSGLRPRLRRRRRAMATLVFAAYAWWLLALVGLPTLFLVAAIPVRSWRRSLVRRAARSLVRLSGTSLRVHGAQRVPDGPCIVVANHASWLDAPVLAAVLPSRFSFVAGEVFARQHVAGFLLRRIGTQFVERYDTSEAAADASRLAQLARQTPLVFFPEGGLARASGLRSFHLGAFVAAAQAGVPIVPIAILGTRSMLRAGHKFARRGTITLVVGEPLAPTGPAWLDAVHLQRQAREVILRHCGEPDLE